MGLIKLLLLFALKLLIYLQERPKHGLDRHCIHKLVGKCDIIMRNCRLIMVPCIPGTTAQDVLLLVYRTYCNAIRRVL